MRAEGEKIRIAVLNEERNEELNEMLRIEEDRLNLKITQFESLIDLNYCQNISALDEYVLKMEEFSSEYFILSKELEMYLGDEYGAFYGPKFKHKTHEIGENMKMAKLLRQNVLEITDNNKNKESEKIRQQNQILMAQNLCNEIDIRCESLENKFDQTLT